MVSCSLEDLNDHIMFGYSKTEHVIKNVETYVPFKVSAGGKKRIAPEN